MRAVDLKEIEEISEFVPLAEHGKTVLVTDQDLVLAELADAVQQGWIRPAASETGTPLRLPVASLDDLLQELQWDRSDR